MMDVVDVLSGVNFALVLLFGVLLSVSFAGGCRSKRDRIVLFALCPVFLAFQTLSWLLWGMNAAKQFYPLYIHLPLLLGLTLGLKKPVGISLASVCAAYLCCQLPRCAGMIITAITASALAGEAAYTVAIAPIFFLLWRYFAPSARVAMAESPKSLLLLGSLPILYYIYDYVVAVRPNLLYSELLSGHTDFRLRIVAEVIPAAAGLLYMVYTVAYREQLQRRTRAELLSSQMAGQLKQAETEMGSLRQAETQAAAYHHDMRHHLTAIDGFLTAGDPGQAQDYIKRVRTDIDRIIPKRFCENELVNLLCSSFSAKAEHMGARLKVDATVPKALTISDTELCALLSNGLENALSAAGTQEEFRRWVELYCGVRLDKLLIEIQNPYSGEIVFRDGLPVSDQPNHGYGCRSIRAITESYQGIYEFSAEGGIFTLRVVLPM